MEILVLHPGALGDIILSLPALSLLRRRYSPARLTLAGNLDFIEAVAGGYADSICSLSTIPLHRLYSPGPFPEEDIRFWKLYDRIVSWTGAGDLSFAGKLAGMGVETKVCAWRPKPGERRHVSQIFVESLYPWIPASGVMPHMRIKVNQERMEEARSWLTRRGWTCGERIFAIHPGAGSVSKRWSVGNLLLLAGRLHREQRVKLLISEGPAERGLGNELAKGLESGAALLAESLPLPLLAALLSFCWAYIGGDSGISHLAAGLGIRSVVLFGPSCPEQWAPLGDRVTIVRASSLDEITAEQVWRIIDGLRLTTDD